MLQKIIQCVWPKRNNGNISPNQIKLDMSSALGDGGYGTVYLGILNTGSSSVTVAVKKIEIYDEALFTREYTILRQLKNCFILKCFGQVELNRNRCIVLELCECSLKQYFSDNPKKNAIVQNPLDKCVLLGQLTVGLSYIHRKRIIHKDLKPENILLCRKTCGSNQIIILKVADFGIGNQLRGGDHYFQKTRLRGTSGYIAPEFLVEEGVVIPTFESDIYALGIVFFFVLSDGQHPFGKPDVLRDYRIVSSSPSFDPIADKGYAVWESIHLISKLIEKIPNKRPDVNLILHHPFFTLNNEWARSWFVSNVYKFLKCTPRTNYNRYRLLYQLRKEKVETWFNQMKTQSEHQIIRDYFGTDNPPLDCLEILSPVHNREFDYFDLNEIINSSPKIYTYLWFLITSLNFSRDEYQQYFQVTDFQFGLLYQNAKEREILFKEIGDDENIPLNLSPLYTAVCLSSIDMVEFVLKVKGNHLQLRDKFGRSALHFAVRFSSPEIVDQLLRLGADPNDVDLMKETVLQAAVRYRPSIEIVQFLLEAGANVNRPGKFQQTVLHVAAENATPEIVFLLLEKNAYTRAVDGFGQTVLHSAVLNTSIDIVNYLLERDANIDVVDKDGKSVLHFAARHSTEEMVRFLVTKGAKITTVDNSGETVLHAAARNTSSRIVQLLLDKGVPIDGRNKKGETSLHLAAEHSTLDVVQVLLQYGADLNAVDQYDRTVLHFAAKNVNPEILKTFLDNQVDLHSVDKFGRTACHVACEHSIPEVVQFLLDYNANTETIDKKEQTVLHYAAKNFFPEIVDLLLQKGVNINAKNTSNQTAAQLAVFRSSVDIINLINEFMNGNPSEHN